MSRGVLSPRVDAPIDRVSPVNWLHPLNRGLISCWLAPRGATGGARYHDLCRLHDGILMLMDPVTDWVIGDLGFGAIDFDNVDDYVRVPFAPRFDRLLNLTLICRVFITGAGASNEGIVAKWHTTDEDFLLWGGASSSIRFGADNSSATIWASGWTTLNDGKWHTLGATRNGSTVVIYADGVAKQTTTDAGNLPGANTADFNLNFGNYADNAFSGSAPIRIGPVWLYGVTLSAAEMAAQHLEVLAGCPGTLNRIPLPFAMQEAAGGLSIPIASYHYRHHLRAAV